MVFSWLRSGKDLKKEINACSSVIFELPNDNVLRKALSDIKAELEGQVDQQLGSIFLTQYI